MYDAPRYSVKDHFEDAVALFERASEMAGQAGDVEEAERLKNRSHHVRMVYNSQFRGI